MPYLKVRFILSIRFYGRLNIDFFIGSSADCWGIDGSGDATGDGEDGDPAGTFGAGDTMVTAFDAGTVGGGDCWNIGWDGLNVVS